MDGRGAVLTDTFSPVACDRICRCDRIVGVVLQTSVFHIYGRLRGSLSTGAPGLAAAAIAAVRALGGDAA